MLIRKNYIDKNNSLYICDRCKTELNGNNKIGVYISIGIKSSKKKWDLCQHCYKALQRGINKGKEG